MNVQKVTQAADQHQARAAFVANECTEALAASELRLLEHVAVLESERDAYRMLAQRALDHLYGEQQESKRLRDAFDRLREEFRALRGQVLQASGVAA